MPSPSSAKRNLFIGFGISMLLLIASSIASYWSINKLLISNRWVNHTDSVLLRLESVHSLLSEAEAQQRGYLLSGNTAYLNNYVEATSNVESAVAEVKWLTTDNYDQQKSIIALDAQTRARIAAMEAVINARRDSGILDQTQLEKGRMYMASVVRLIRQMEDKERSLLEVRTGRLERYAMFTPIFLVVVAIVSLVITIVFFYRVVRDIDRRARMQQELEHKDEDITRRIDIVRNLAARISEGNYDIRVADEGTDGLGSLSDSLNKMAQSLKSAFTLLRDNEWQQAGMVRLSQAMLGITEERSLANVLLTFLVEYTESIGGAIYMVKGDILHLLDTYAINPEENRELLTSKTGLAGQVLAGGKTIKVSGITAGSLKVDYVAGSIVPTAIICLPTYSDGVMNGVIELLGNKDFDGKCLAFLETAARQAGIALQMAISRTHLKELLEETQAQSEELKAQQTELESLNTELETQAESLQASEEELKMQQAELQQANADLEERAHQLEEQNQVIAERNLEIQQKADELEQSTRYKSEFMANMSHELRTPLNSILLLSRLLHENKEANLLPDQVESARVIQNSGKALLTLIDEILDLSKIEAGKMDVEYAEVDLKGLMDDIRSVFAPVAREKKIDFVYTIQPGVPSSMETDRMKLEQILKNLISNALKFTSKGSVSITASLNKELPDYLSFSVTDTGIGIPGEKLQLIFEAFMQADGSTKRMFGGTGLGLSISRELARLLGGEITVTSSPGAGSTFTLNVPLRKLAAPATLQQKTSPNTQRSDVYISKEIPEGIDDDRDAHRKGEPSILIVEDDTNFALSLLTLTRKNGFSGIVTVRGDEAVDLAKKYRPAGILLDIKLPVKSGWEVMDDLKKDPETAAIPVHIMTSEKSTRQHSLPDSGVEFMAKPVSPEKLEEVFRSLKMLQSHDAHKVLIIEESQKHAEALALFLGSYGIELSVHDNVADSISALSREEQAVAIAWFDIMAADNLKKLELLKQTEGFEKMQIIAFTGKSVSRTEEARIRQFADSIILKTAHSYQRVLDEVSLFLHRVEGASRKSVPMSAPAAGMRSEDILKGRKVLVADDDVRNIFSLTRALESNGMIVLSAMDGAEAVSMVTANPDTDVILMDMMMPEMDGYEAIRAIRKMQPFRRTPILAVTAKAMADDRNKCIQAGASDYISKPVDIDQLLSLLRVWLHEK